MNANLNSPVEKHSRLSGSLVAGGILVMSGLITLAARFIDLPPMLFPLGLGIIFLAAGLLARTSGLLIPGGILTGIFAGASLIEGPFSTMADPSRGGVFLAAFAGGWVLISLLSLYTEGVRSWWSWPLYPAVVIGLVGVALLAGDSGFKVLEFIGTIWPVFLIAAGLYLVLKRRPA